MNNIKKISYILLVLTLIFSFSACNKKPTQDEEIKKFVADKTEEEIKKNKESYNDFITMLDEVDEKYQEAIVKNDEKLYKESRKALGSATFNFDGIINNFPQKISLEINDLIIKIDDMQGKKDTPENVTKTVKEIKDLVDSVYQ